MNKYRIIENKESEDSLSDYVFKSFKELDVAGWLRSGPISLVKEIRSGSIDMDRAFLSLMCSSNFVTDEVSEYVTTFLEKGELVDGLIKQIERIIGSGLYKKVPTVDKAFEELLRHCTAQVAALWANFSLLFQQHGLVLETVDVVQFCTVGTIWSLAVGAETALKFVLCDAYARWVKDERPKAPAGMKTGALFVMFGPSLRHSLNRKTLSVFRNPRERHIFQYSVNQLKKGTNAIPSWDIDVGLRETFVALTTNREVDDMYKNVNIKELLYQSIYDVCQEVLRPVSIRTRPLLPSVSATEDRTRREGGGLTGTSEKIKWCVLEKDGQIVDTLPIDTDCIEGEYIELTALPQDLLRNLWEDGRSENPTATIHEVLEPFKLRVITTGPSVDYYLAKYVNRIVHRQLMRHPTFCFTARPVNLEDLEDLYLWEDEKLASADFKSATNELLREMSEWTNLCISARLGWSLDYHEWSTRLLTRVELICELHNGEVLRGQQENGQLMGCPLSFPVLCLINAAVGRVASFVNDKGHIPLRKSILTADLTPAGEIRVRRDPQGPFVIRKTLRQCRLKINGDDNVLAIRPAMYDIFVALCKRAGFQLSIGKSYTSREFGMINSKLFLYGFDGAVWRPTEIVPYMNVGLIKGTGRVLSDSRKDGLDAVDFFSNCGTKAHKLIDGFIPAEQESLMSIFINWNKSVLTTTSRDWYLSRCLGGLDLPLLGDRAPRLSVHAAIVASYAQSQGGVSLDKPEVTCEASLRYRRAIPHVLVDRAELPEDTEIRDDTVLFWKAGILVRDTVAGQAEARFWKFYRQALKERVAPLSERITRRWASVPTVNFNVTPLPLPFIAY